MLQKGERRLCAVPGCRENAQRIAGLCSTHSGARRRQGHELQTRVTEPELAPFRAAFRRRKALNEDNPIWGITGEQWATVLGHAEAVVARRGRGVPGATFEFQAALEVSHLGSRMTALDVLENVFALKALEDMRPGRFQSDRATEAQIVKTLRRRAGWRVRKGAQGEPPVPVEIAPNVREVMAKWLRPFVVTALWMVAQDRKEREGKEAGAADQMERVKAALESLR